MIIGLGFCWEFGVANTDYLVDLIARGLVVPAFQAADQQYAGARPALIAVVAASAVAIVKTETVFPATDRARAVLVGQEAGVDAEYGQDFAPSVAGALDRVEGHVSLPIFIGLAG